MFFACALFAAVMTQLSDLASAVEADTPGLREAFCVTGTVSYVVGYHENLHHIVIEQDGIGVDIHGHTDAPPQRGDIIRIEGQFEPRGAGSIQPQFWCFEVLGRGKASEAITGPATEIMDGHCDFRLAHLVGEIRDVEPSGTDPCWNYLSLISDGNLYYAPIPTKGAELNKLEDLIGSTVRLEGIPDPHNCSYRFLDERRFLVADIHHISILETPSGDLFARTPSINRLHHLSAEKIARLGRHKATGRILTLWQSRNALIELSDERKVVVSSSESINLRRGQAAEIVGYPSTDGFTLRLSRAIARPVDGSPFTEQSPLVFSEDAFRKLLTTDYLGKSQLQGRRIRLCGKVAEFLHTPETSGQFQITIANHLLDIDCAALGKEVLQLAPGCFVRITGTCVLETENWNLLSNGLQLNGIRLVLDKPDDLKILSRPPWWTPTKLSILVIILLLLLAVFILWNRTLRQLSEKRGRELYRERSANALAAFKTEERTRLAVELHDSISQILTGAAMQLDAGEVGAAKRILASCRRELRCCLWDLRSNTLDTHDFAEAIRETIAPHLRGHKASIDFPVQADSLSESLRHAALRIIREATVNAIRHGHAETIAISGELQDRQLAFTIVDDGLGFDPSCVPGSMNGHFGLQGMRERTKAFNGTIDITSSPGNGTEVSVTLEEETFFANASNDDNEK